MAETSTPVTLRTVLIRISTITVFKAFFPDWSYESAMEELIHSVHCQPFVTRQGNCCVFLFAFLHTKLSTQRSTLKEKNLWPRVRNSFPLRKHAYSNILKFLPPNNESFQIKSLMFFIFLLKNINCGYSLEPPRRGSSNAEVVLTSTHNLCFWAEVKKKCIPL